MPCQANEIDRVHGGLLESKWVGHSSKTFMKHYGNVQQADIVAACGTVAKPLQHGGAQDGTVVLTTKEHHEKSRKHDVAALCNILNPASVPPLGLEQSPSSSGNSNEPTATVANTLQLAAQLRGLDRSELEQLLLTLLSKAESGPE